MTICQASNSSIIGKRRYGYRLKVTKVVLCGWTACACIGIVSGYSQEFRVEGEIAHRIFVAGTNILAARFPNPTNRFSVAVKGCEYLISVETAQGNIYTTTYDGSDLYQLTAIKTPSNVLYSAIIEHSSIPPDNGTTVNYLWLAYAGNVP